MTRYLLDANAVMDLLNGTGSNAARRVRLQQPSDVAISAIVAHELLYGAFKNRRAAQNVALIDALQLAVLEIDKEDSRHPSAIRAMLTSEGTPIGPYDALIAGQAVARKLILVTHNTQEFERVPGLRFEDWRQ